MKNDQIASLFRKAFFADDAELKLLLESLDAETRSELEELLKADIKADENGLFESMQNDSNASEERGD